MLTGPDEAKRALRALLRGVPGPTAAESAALCDRLLALALPAGWCVAGMAPLPGEPDLMPAWDALHARGHPVLLPETTPRGEALRFRRWHPEAALRMGRHGTRHPDGPPAEPDLVFVPLLAWDRGLRRLGRGGGYYDRTLAALPHAVAIGVGPAAREVARVPTGPHDATLDGVLTAHHLLLPEGRRFADLVSGRHRRP